ncbi:hypothetical protein B0H67DRAFT_640323 [Lasiosphaeris hirsuta]|uniref:Uncharacterized protein n=1 Tax=Lasiosphaeris hirsuta TaxID=260670 RepID=A0AA40BD69_9PEZI|nr:hypothetical protein B0H67DRAFT_640323 [Lasiosphaeris hirsuta]
MALEGPMYLMPDEVIEMTNAVVASDLSTLSEILETVVSKRFDSTISRDLMERPNSTGKVLSSLLDQNGSNVLHLANIVEFALSGKLCDTWDNKSQVCYWLEDEGPVKMEFLEQKTKAGLTPTDLAEMHENKEVLESLKSYGRTVLEEAQSDNPSVGAEQDR